MPRSRLPLLFSVVSVASLVAIAGVACGPHAWPKGPPPEYEAPPPPSWLDGGDAMADAGSPA